MDVNRHWVSGPLGRGAPNRMPLSIWSRMSLNIALFFSSLIKLSVSPLHRTSNNIAWTHYAQMSFQKDNYQVGVIAFQRERIWNSEHLYLFYLDNSAQRVTVSILYRDVFPMAGIQHFPCAVQASFHSWQRGIYPSCRGSCKASKIHYWENRYNILLR